MASQPEQQARGDIDRLLEAAGWRVRDASAANFHGARDMPIREFLLRGYDSTDRFRHWHDEDPVAISDKSTSLILGRARTSC